MKAPVYYSIVRYLPDPVREEQVNVGVVVVTEKGEYLGSRFDRSLTRVRCLSPREDLSLLRDFAASLQEKKPGENQLFLPIEGAARWNLTSLRSLHTNWGNSIRLTEPRPAVDVDPTEFLEESFARFVAMPMTDRKRGRDKRWVVRRVAQGLSERIEHVMPARDVTSVVRRHARIAGAVEEHAFDLVIQIDRPRYAVEAVSFEVEADDELEKAVTSVAWSIDDVRKNYRTPQDLPMAVVALEGDHSREFQRMRRICDYLRVDLVPNAQFEQWADIAVSTATKIPAAAG